MMPIKRETMIISLPIDNQGIKSQGSFENGSVAVGEGRIYIQLYLNPESFNITERKIIGSQLTKGGYNVQYWGEDLQKIQIGGSTGSGGIEYINLLRSIYRHEQIQFKKILNERLYALREEARQASLESNKDLKPDYSNDFQGFLAGATDFFSDGLYSGLVNGAETLTDVLTGDFVLPNRKEYANFSNSPSLASLAFNIEIYYQGEIYRGYFDGFTTTEQATQQGIFNYQTSFTVLERRGERKNYMPWHRSPINQGTGEPQKASVPTEGQRLDELSFQYEDSVELTLSSTFLQDEDSINNRGVPFKPINRRG